MIIDSGNDYIVAVKGNQPKLYRHIQSVAAQLKPASRYITIETSRDRVTQRTVEVFHDLMGLAPDWTGLQSFIRVERIGTRAGKPYHEIVRYISSLRLTAQEFAHAIRSHWGIENRLHWVKDVVLHEDDSTILMGNAPTNLSVIRAIAINLLRRNGHSSITSAQRFLCHDLDKLLALVE